MHIAYNNGKFQLSENHSMRLNKVSTQCNEGRARRFVFLASLVWLLSCTFGVAAGLSPDSPEVREAVTKGLAFLETQNGGGMGGQALLGLTLAKSGTNLDHPKIKEAVATIKGSLAAGVEKLNSDIYSVGVSIMFLVAVNPKEHRYEIEALVRWLHLKQKEYGAWGYPLDSPNGKTCDTSMTHSRPWGYGRPPTRPRSKLHRKFGSGWQSGCCARKTPAAASAIRDSSRASLARGSSSRARCTA